MNDYAGYPPQWVPGIFYVSTLYYPNYSGLDP